MSAARGRQRARHVRAAGGLHGELHTALPQVHRPLTHTGLQGLRSYTGMHFITWFDLANSFNVALFLHKINML